MLQLFEMRFRFPNPPRSKLISKRVSSGSFIEFEKRLLKLTEKSKHSFSKVKPAEALIALLLEMSCLKSKMLVQLVSICEINDI